MKTYRNEKHGFEIEIPEAWHPAPAIAYKLMGVFSEKPPPGVSNDCFQYGCPDEAFNFEVAPLFPEPDLNDTEIEFTLFARNGGYTDLHFGRIIVAGKEHVSARYFINDRMGKRWNKKYMIVFGGIEYAITATCNDPQWFEKREKDWDEIIRSFHVLAPVDESANASSRAERLRERRREIVRERIEMRENSGDLYARAYEHVAMGRLAQARSLLEACIREVPDHVLAHKELAVVLLQTGDIRGALRQRKEVRRLCPADFVNRVKLVELLAGSGRRSEALREVRELLATMPAEPRLKELEQKLIHHRFADYRMLFFSSLAVLLLLNLGLWSGSVSIRDVWCMRLMMIVPVGGMLVSGPWAGIPRMAAGLAGGVLYLLFWIRA